MRVRFLSPAENELVAAADYYFQISPQLGSRFLAEVDQATHRMRNHPHAWAQVTKRHRRCRLRSFPFGLVYSVGDNELLVAAVMDLRRDPESRRI